ncbi:hypothetical protein LAZ67_10000015 [Cordylochernes scorpioides]|uniref:Uncharacterized protein n=1 Tax=Cordylochernes scorpioides TaxID=51811 RepID=A0ABY6KXH9_9ARAC|nr:hypothetical protein LAZ67_10000015 [Cordylochernes scorpioides]
MCKVVLKCEKSANPRWNYECHIRNYVPIFPCLSNHPQQLQLPLADNRLFKIRYSPSTGRPRYKVSKIPPKTSENFPSARPAITSTNLVPLETSRSAVQAPERPSTGSQPGDELAPKDESEMNFSKENSLLKSQKDAN